MKGSEGGIFNTSTGVACKMEILTVQLCLTRNVESLVFNSILKTEVKILDIT